MAGDDQTHGGGKQGEIVAWESEVCGEDVIDLTVREFREGKWLNGVEAVCNAKAGLSAA